ncbi:hypothetical protein [Flammeovirga sp. SJP92]|uniref:hypothetical protein n=1 Tax=Flammeovirga sp. SJP92 TaxID=1775430 RepID=UPI0012F74CA3|nr:hypothetical protein [Flammeovirga sp. SJP92]
MKEKTKINSVPTSQYRFFTKKELEQVLGHTQLDKKQNRYLNSEQTNGQLLI